jgi:hypothetical protein
MPINVFMSVGRTFTQEQEQFVTAVEDYLKRIGLNPLTVGRSYIKNQQPLRSVEQCMRDCSGAVILAFERVHITKGVEKPNSPDEQALKAVGVPTVWNQIEAAMAYTLGIPLLVIIQHGLRSEGLLEKGYDWYVKWVRLEKSALEDPEFIGLLSDWKSSVERVYEKRDRDLIPSSGGRAVNPGEMTLYQIVKALKPAQLWSFFSAIGAVIAAAAAIAFKLGSIGAK